MNLSEIIGFYNEINKLKTTLRYSNYDNVLSESVADHTWKMIFMAIDLHEKLKIEVDILKTAKIITIHDLPEYVLDKDIDANDIRTRKVKKEDKHNKEEKVLKHLCEKYNSMYIYDLWHEYEKQDTREAKFARALDKIETNLHMMYQNGNIINFDHTVTYCDESVANFPELIPLLEQLKLEYKDFFERKGYPWDNRWDTSHLS